MRKVLMSVKVGLIDHGLIEQFEGDCADQK